MSSSKHTATTRPKRVSNSLTKKKLIQRRSQERENSGVHHQCGQDEILTGARCFQFLNVEDRCFELVNELDVLRLEFGYTLNLCFYPLSDGLVALDEYTSRLSSREIPEVSTTYSIPQTDAYVPGIS